MRGPEFYWQNRRDLWLRLREYTVGFEDSSDYRRDIRVAASDEIGAAERTEEVWSVRLPGVCVVCGADAEECPWQDESRQVPDLTVPLWTGVSALAVGLVGLIWHWWAGPLIWLAGTLAGRALRREMPVRVRFRRCDEHQADREYPALRRFADTLVIRVGNRDVRREFFHPGSSQAFRQPAATDSRTAAPSREMSGDAGQISAAPPNLEPIPLADVDGDVAIVADRAAAIPLPALERTLEDLPLAPEPVDSLALEPSEAPLPLADAVLPLAGLSKPLIGTSAAPRVCRACGQRMLPNERRCKACHAPWQDPSLASSLPSSTAAGAVLSSVSEQGGLYGVEQAAVARPEAKAPLRPAAPTPKDEVGPLSMRELLAVPFQGVVVNVARECGQWNLLFAIMLVVGAVLVRMPDGTIRAAGWLILAAAIPCLVLLACLIVTTYFNVVRAFETGSREMGFPQLWEVFLFLGVCFFAALFGLLWSGAGLAVYHFAYDGLPALQGMPKIQMPASVGKMPMVEGDLLHPVILLAAVGVLAGAFYAPMGIALAAAYRVLNPLRVIKALIVCLPGYLAILAYLIPLAIVVTLLAWAAMLVVGMLGGYVVTLAPETFGPPFATYFPMLVVFVLSVVQYYVEISRYGMLGLLLRHNRQRIFPKGLDQFKST